VFRALIRSALRQPTFVLLTALLIVGLAAWQVPRMPVDVFPELNAPTVVVLTEAPGLAADEVEQNVTVPLEAQMGGLAGVRRLRSASAIGLSLLWVEFDWGEDIYRARTLVAEKLAAARDALPPDAHAEITPITSITGEIMLLSVSSPDGSVPPMDLRSFAEFDLRTHLMAIPGIAQVVAIGGELAEYQVLVRPDDLQLFGLTIDDVTTAARNAHTTLGAGYLPEVDGLELPIRQSGRVRSIADITGTTITWRDGHAVTIGHVADVVLAPAPRRGTGAEAAKPAVVMSVQKSPGTNTLLLTQAIDDKIAELRAAMPPGITINPHVMRQADFIRLSVDNLIAVLRDAAIFVAIVLVLFLLDVRTTLITLTALPLSIAVAFLVLWALGLSINVMTLGGLAVAIGELVDDAIIDVENVFRRLRENAARPAGERRPVLRVVFDASNEIRSSVVFATTIICLVFVPLLFLQGLEGRFFRPLGIAYIVATLASLVTALTVTPVLCRLLLARVGPGTQHDGFLVRWLAKRYARALAFATRRPKPVLAASLLATVLSIGLGATFGTSFLPAFNEGTFTVFLMAPPGTSLHESDRLANSVERRLVAIDGVRAVVRRTGRAERDEHAEPVSNSEIEVTVLPGHDMAAVRRAIDQVLGSVPGITTSVGQPIEHRLSHVLSGTPAAIAITAYGTDLGVLRDLAPRIEAELRRIPGTRDITANREVMITPPPPGAGPDHARRHHRARGAGRPSPHRPDRAPAPRRTQGPRRRRRSRAAWPRWCCRAPARSRRFRPRAHVEPHRARTGPPQGRRVLQRRRRPQPRPGRGRRAAPHRADRRRRRLQPRRRRPVRGAAVREPHDPRVRRRRARDHADAGADGPRLHARRPARARQPAAEPARRHPRHLRHRVAVAGRQHAGAVRLRRPLHGTRRVDRQHGRLHHAVRHRRAQRHPARAALLRPVGRRCTVGRGRAARVDGAARADPDDRADGGAGPLADRARPGRARQRDPGAAVGRRARRPAVVDVPQPRRRAGGVLAAVPEQGAAPGQRRGSTLLIPLS
jgi:multidrug efflux pump subunit AcrB